MAAVAQTHASVPFRCPGLRAGALGHPAKVLHAVGLSLFPAVPTVTVSGGNRC